MKPKQMVLGGRTFILNPIKPRQALRITKELVQLIGAGLKGGDKQQIMAAISSGLSSMSDDEFEEFCLLMFRTTQAITEEGPVELNTPEGFDQAFSGVDLENIFVLMYEVLVYNRFPLVRDLDLNIGELIESISLSVKEETNEKESQKNTESLEN